MGDRFDGFDSYPPGREGIRRTDGISEYERLEEVGDLHFQAAAYSTALDYYRQILPAAVLDRFSPARALAILRKALNAHLNLGQMKQVDVLLVRAHAVLKNGVDLAPAELARERALFMVRQAVLLMQRSDHQAALDVAKRAFAILALTDFHAEVANLQLIMGGCHQRMGRLDKAEEFYLDSLSTFRRVGDEVGAASLYGNLALLYKVRCCWGKALDLMDKAIALVEKHGAPQLLTGFFLNQGLVYLKVGRFAEAQLVFDKSLRLCRSLGDQIREPKVLLALGRLEFLEGRLARAEETVLAGKALAERLRMRRESVIADEYFGDIQLGRADPQHALETYGFGLEKNRGLAHAGDLEAELLRRVAEAQRQLGHHADAIATAHAAIAACEASGEVYEFGFCRLTLAHAYAAQGDWEQADAHFRGAIDIFRGQHLDREWCDTVLQYLETRLESADKPVLLLLRRFLIDAQAQAAAEIGDVTLYDCLRGLVRVQLRLGLFDDALLTVFELERHARGLDDPERLTLAERLRQVVEAGMVGGLEEAGSPLVALSGIPGLFSAADGSLTRNLGSVLTAVREKVGADVGFLALGEPGKPATWGPAARQGVTENLVGQLLRWFADERNRDGGDQALLVSRVSRHAALGRAVPALAENVASCVFMPITVHDRVFGFLFLGRTVAEDVACFDQQALDFLATYMGFLALFLTDKMHPAAEPLTASEADTFGNVITRNEQMLDVLLLIRKVAPSDLTVLLRGETGTGKGLLAYALHALSRRSERRFVAINCAAIPETLLESELFGHLKGSFTGADVDKKGLLVEAEGGTVFLDEIGKMPLTMQGKLLHFLDTKVVRPVGSAQERAVDVRIVCASKSDLRQLVESGRFLEDLYFRLLDFPIVVPPLRERPDDIPLLAGHFVQRFAGELATEAPEIGNACMDALVQFDWRGNVRELEKCLKRAMILAQGEPVLRPDHLPREMVPYLAGGGGADVMPLRDMLAAVESREIARALRMTAGNKAAAARRLQISYPNLLKKIRFFGLADET